MQCLQLIGSFDMLGYQLEIKCMPHGDDGLNYCSIIITDVNIPDESPVYLEPGEGHAAEI